jgi:DNA-binding CsgD family transcriptional regulator
VSRAAARTRFVLQVVPLAAEPPGAFPEPQAAALAFLREPGASAQPDAAKLKHFYRLTPAEIRLVKMLCEGADVASAAAHSGVAVATARTQLKSVFAKTGVSRQGELLKMMFALSAIR